MLKSRFTAVLLAALILFNPALAQVESQAGGALLGGALIGAASAVAGAIVVGAVWSFPSPSGDPYDPSPLLPALLGATAGAALGYPCGTACGTTTVGNWQDRNGNNGLAYAGAYLGLPVGIGLVCLGILAQGSALEVPLYAAGVLAPPAGAVIGYNLRAPRNDSQNAFVTRLTSPTLAFSAWAGRDRQRCSVFDCRLLTVRS